MQRRCCCPRVSPRALRVEPVRNLGPEADRLETLLQALFEVRFGTNSQHDRTEGNVVEDTLWKRVGPLKNHSHFLSQQDHIRVGGIDILSVKRNDSLDTGVGDEVIHSVQGAKKG